MTQGHVAVSSMPGFTEESFRVSQQDRHEPNWAVAKRRRAFEAFVSKPMPALNHEEWRRTDIRALKLDSFTLAGLDSGGEGHGAAPEAFAPHLAKGQFAGSMFQVDGQHVSVELADELAKKGVIYCSMDEAVREHRELVEPHFLTRCVDPNYDKFSALHAAFWAGGAFLYVPRGVRIEEPLYFLTGLSAAASSDLSHTLVILEDGAEATIFQEQTSAEHERQALHVGAIELFVGDGARLSYVNLQNWDNRVDRKSVV